MFSHIKDLKEAWEQGLINLYPMALGDKGNPAYFSAPVGPFVLDSTEAVLSVPSGKGHTCSNVGLTYFPSTPELLEQAQAHLNRPETKPFFSQAFFWDKSPFESFESLMDAQKRFDNWCILTGKQTDKKIGLAFIDIDGIKLTTNGEYDKEIRKQSCDELYTALKENLEIDFFTEQSGGGGYHIFYLTTQQVTTQNINILQQTQFPQTSQFKNTTINQKRTNKNLNKDFIEIFTQKKYAVCSPTKNYIVLADNKDGIELTKFKPVTNINKEIKKALTKAGYTPTPPKKTTNNPQTEHTQFTGNTNELQQHFTNYHKIGSRNEIKYKFTALLKKSGWTLQQILDFYRTLPVEQDIHKVEQDAKRIYNEKNEITAGLTGVLEDITQYCDEETKQETLEYFKTHFGNPTQDLKKQYTTFSNENITLKENAIYIQYDVAEHQNPEEEITHGHKSPNNTNLAIIQDQYGYGFEFTHTHTYTHAHPTRFTSLIYDTKIKNNIQNISKYQNIRQTATSIKNFINHIEENPQIQQLYLELDKNAKIKQKIQEINQKTNQQQNDTLQKIHLLNNDHITNNTNKIKIITEKEGRIYKTTTNGTLIPTYTPTATIDKAICLNATIQNYTKYKDKLKIQNKEEIQIKNTYLNQKIEYTTPKDLIDNLPSGIGTGKPNEVNIAINTIIDYMQRAQIAQNKEYYSIEEGIFYNGKTFDYVENGETREITPPTTEELTKAGKTLLKFYKHTKTQDKSKLTYLINWFAKAPYIYHIRNKGLIEDSMKVPNLVGNSDAGKSAITEVLQLIWGKTGKRKGTEIKTIAQLSSLLNNEGGFPTIIDEVGKKILKDPEFTDVLKSIYDSNFSRSVHRYQLKEKNWDYRQITCATMPVMTTNHVYKHTEKSAVKRLINIMFYPKDVSTKKEQNEWRETFNYGEAGLLSSEFVNLEAIGRYIFHKINKKWDWKNIFQDITEWDNELHEYLKLEYLDDSKIETIIERSNQDEKDIIESWILQQYNKEDRLHYGSTFVEEESEFGKSDRLGRFKEAVYQGRIIGVDLASDPDYIIITSKIYKGIEETFDAETNEGLAALYGTQLRHRTYTKKQKRGAKIPIEDLNIR